MIDKKKAHNIIKFPSELSKTEKEIEAILFASEERNYKVHYIITKQTCHYTVHYIITKQNC